MSRGHQLFTSVSLNPVLSLFLSTCSMASQNGGIGQDPCRNPVNSIPPHPVGTALFPCWRDCSKTSYIKRLSLNIRMLIIYTSTHALRDDT